MAQLNIIGEFHPPSGSQYTAREHNIHAPKTYYAFCGPQGNEKKRPVRFFGGVLAVISVYNKNKGGVDGADKQFSFHRLKEVSEGMEKDALHIVQQILFNAYVLYKSNTSEKVMSRLQFLQEVIYGLPLSYPNEPTAPVQLRQTPENSKLVKLVGTYLFMNKCRLFISGQNLVYIVRYVAWKEKS